VNAFDNEVRLQLYRSFVASGRAPVAADVAQAMSASVGDVEDAFRRLHDEHVIVLAPGTPYVWMANPLSAIPTPFEVESDGKRFWGNCIWDALGILAMLDSDGHVETRCPDCGEAVQVEVRDGGITPKSHVVHYAVPAARWWEDIGST
jgi:hypothetical protein